MWRDFVLLLFSLAIFDKTRGEGRYDDSLLTSAESWPSPTASDKSAAHLSPYGGVDRLANDKNTQHFRIDNPSRPKSTLGRTTAPPSVDKSELWGYADNNGPPRWLQTCRDGVRQSPVDFRASDVDYVMLSELQFVGYDIFGPVNVRNNGHGVQVDGFDLWRQQDRPHIYGGGLKGRYTLTQFHFHWSYGHDDGSEHTVGTLHYPVEIHLVHTKDGYSADEVKSKPDGIAVVGVFVTLGEDGAAWATLDGALRKVTYKDDNTRIFNYTVGVNLPANTQNFYRYAGSLTTPDCNEAVVWTVLAEPIRITDAQLKVLRTVKIGTRETLPDSNTRPTQPLNGRRIQYRSVTLSHERICGASNGAATLTGSTVSKFLNLRFRFLAPVGAAWLVESTIGMTTTRTFRLNSIY